MTIIPLHSDLPGEVWNIQPPDRVINLIPDMICSQDGHGRHGAHIFKTSLEQPMMIQVKKGQAKDILVSQHETDCISKIKLMVVKDLVKNVENQQLKVVKKESIMKPFDLASQPKKINLSME